MIMHLKTFAAALLLGLTAQSGSAAPVLLDSSNLNFSVSGSPNTIVGSWHGDSLQVWSLDAVSFFKVELGEFDSAFGAASSIALSNGLTGIRSGGFSLCSNPVSCVGEIALDQPYEVLPSPASAWNFFTSLIDGYYVPAGITSGGAGVTYPSGGLQAAASGRFVVSVWGEGQAVPAPSSLWLVVGALCALAVVRPRRRRPS